MGCGSGGSDQTLTKHTRVCALGGCYNKHLFRGHVPVGIGPQKSPKLWAVAKRALAPAPAQKRVLLCSFSVRIYRCHQVDRNHWQQPHAELDKNQPQDRQQMITSSIQPCPWDPWPFSLLAGTHEKLDGNRPQDCLKISRRTEMLPNTSVSCRVRSAQWPPFSPVKQDRKRPRERQKHTRMDHNLWGARLSEATIERANGECLNVSNSNVPTPHRQP